MEQGATPILDELRKLDVKAVQRSSARLHRSAGRYQLLDIGGLPNQTLTERARSVALRRYFADLRANMGFVEISGRWECIHYYESVGVRCQARTNGPMQLCQDHSELELGPSLRLKKEEQSKARRVVKWDARGFFVTR